MVGGLGSCGMVRLIGTLAVGLNTDDGLPMMIETSRAIGVQETFHRADADTLAVNQR